MLGCKLGKLWIGEEIELTPTADFSPYLAFWCFGIGWDLLVANCPWRRLKGLGPSFNFKVRVVWVDGIGLRAGSWLEEGGFPGLGQCNLQ